MHDSALLTQQGQIEQIKIDTAKAEIGKIVFNI